MLEHLVVVKDFGGELRNNSVCSVLGNLARKCSLVRLNLLKVSDNRLNVGDDFLDCVGVGQPFDTCPFGVFEINRNFTPETGDAQICERAKNLYLSDVILHLRCI